MGEARLEVKSHTREYECSCVRNLTYSLILLFVSTLSDAGVAPAFIRS